MLRGHRRSRFWAAALFLILVSGGAHAAAAGQAISFGADPGPGAPTQSGYFTLSLTPGSSISEPLRVSNSGAQTAQLDLAPVDATTGQNGGVAFSADNSKPILDGSWIQLNTTSLSLPPGTQKTITFTVTVPRGARPGVHLAGIAVYAPDQTTEQTVQTQGASGAGAALFVQSRRVVAVQVTLPGPHQPRLVVNGITTQGRPNGLNAILSITNAGYGLTHGTGHLSVTGPLSLSRDLSLDTFVPNTSINYPVLLAAQVPSGTYHFVLTLAYAGSSQGVTYTQNVAVGAVQQTALSNRRVPSGGGRTVIVLTKGISPGFVGWALAAVAALTALALGTTAAARRRRQSLT
jgi:hypothetical protein